ncbi:sulfite exporter TauE/SafE family protein [Actinoplanes solisilvae]|uniref:sulfite exporter TauE/SafE family protein n=1 Tax=Actinoplanes solisilvae TaxID=2486853 RepID=UPI000FDBFE71|nr:sulfite exporter TauE/SafE family protein [Actinoplanes solisilvae]
MTMALIVTVILAAGIGVTLGLLGGGGSILAVPLLVYVADLPAKEAIATSLLVVGATSAIGVIPHARRGRVRWRTGLIFGFAGMTGAYAGGRVAVYISGAVLLTAFALMMLATAIAMIRGRRSRPDRPVPHELPVLRVIVDGVVVGLVTGLVGAGGGFLVVPALALIGGLPMPVAVGTSLLVIAMKSFAGLGGYLADVHINWELAAAVTVAAIVGSLLGGKLAGRVHEDLLRKAFGWFVLGMGVFVLAQQLPARLWSSPQLWTVISVLAAATVGIALVVRRRRHHAPANQPRHDGERVSGSHGH